MIDFREMALIIVATWCPLAFLLGWLLSMRWSRRYWLARFEEAGNRVEEEMNKRLVQILKDALAIRQAGMGTGKKTVYDSNIPLGVVIEDTDRVVIGQMAHDKLPAARFYREDGTDV